MSTEPTELGRASGKEPETETPTTNGARRWGQVEEEHRAVLRKNKRAVSFTIPSAEGITMYQGIDAHETNGRMRELAKKGLDELVDQIHRERASDSEQSATQAARVERPSRVGDSFSGWVYRFSLGRFKWGSRKAR